MARKQVIRLKESMIAETYATELLEFFRSNTASQLKDYLSTNPVLDSLGPYPLCSHINILDRTLGKILNEDSIAFLPPNSLDGLTPETRANRYYQIQVANVVGTATQDEISVDKTLCAKTGKDIRFFGQPDPAGSAGDTELREDDKFLVTVGVSWYSKGTQSGPGERRDVVLTTVIPE